MRLSSAEAIAGNASFVTRGGGEVVNRTETYFLVPLCIPPTMNRKKRHTKSSTDHISTADGIPLATPEATNSKDRKTKTLLEIAADRKAELLDSKPRSTQSPLDASMPKLENIVQVRIGQDGEIVPGSNSSLPAALSSDTSGSEAETPWLDSLLLASSLSAVHFTLSVLAMHQYAEELRFPPLVLQTIFVAFPTLTILISLFRGHLLPPSLTKINPSVNEWTAGLRSPVYVVTANVAGCYLIQLTNDRGYYAVMKDAPSVGTIWVWAVVEMGLLGALAGVVGPGVYAWWFGYGIR